MRRAVRVREVTLAHAMFYALALACLLAAAAAAPAIYDQRQDGDFNVRADVQNVVLIVAVPQKMKLPISDIFGGFKSAHKHENEFQERADVRITEAFVEPSTPYRVEIGSDGERSAGSDGRSVEVVIAGRRRLEAGPPAEPESEEYKLLGAQEQCGPERERDPVTLICRWKPGAEPAAPAAPDAPAAPAAPVAPASQPQEQPEQPPAQPEPVVFVSA